MRLTIKDKEIRDNFNAEYAKLADLEDLEDELGIDLITLFKASKCFYSKILDCYCPHPNPIYKTCGDFGEWYIDFMNNPHKLKDYGKTWALTKEELEWKQF